MIDLAPFIRDVPDFPKKGITFKDITPMLGDAHALAAAIDRLASPWYGKGVTKVIGIESRGFILAPIVAIKLGVGFIPMRKPGKLPWRAISQSYGLEYGSDTIEIHEDSLSKADHVLVVDDVLATGGTMGAALSLVRRLGATPAGAAFLIDLTMLGGAARIGVPVTSVLSY